MSQIENIIVELIDTRINEHDFSRILDEAINDAFLYNDAITGLESRVDDLENIDTESTLTEFGDRIDELERLVKESTAAPAAPISALDRVLPPTDQSLIAGYHCVHELDAYVRATLRSGDESQAPLLIAMVSATMRNLIDREAATDV
jgi:hypothetical protein